MGWMMINDEVIHTSALNPNPVIRIETVQQWICNGELWSLLQYTYKDGSVDDIISSSTI